MIQNTQWAVSRQSEDGRHMTVKNDAGHVICRVPDCDPDAPLDQQERASLIAAAPDMLDALRDAECELHYASNGSINPEAVRDALAKVRAAMIKATKAR